MEIVLILMLLLPVYPAIKTVSKPKTKKCPECGSTIQGDYPVCRVCGRHIGTTNNGFSEFLFAYVLWLIVSFIIVLIGLIAVGSILGAS